MLHTVLLEEKSWVLTKGRTEKKKGKRKCFGIYCSQGKGRLSYLCASRAQTFSKYLEIDVLALNEWCFFFLCSLHLFNVVDLLELKGKVPPCFENYVLRCDWQNKLGSLGMGWLYREQLSILGWGVEACLVSFEHQKRWFCQLCHRKKGGIQMWMEWVYVVVWERWLFIWTPGSLELIHF